MEASIQSISTNSTVVLCGDFNIHNIDWNFTTPTSSDKAAIHLCSIVNNFSFQQLILEPSRGANILDLLLTNDSAAVTSVDIISSLPDCDHEALKFLLCLDPPSQPKTNRVLFNFKAADFDHFRDILGNVPWQLSESDDVDVWWTQWKDLFLAAAYDAIPSVKWKRHKMKNWLSYDTIKLIKKKRSLYRKLQQNPDLRPKYNQLCNLGRKATRTNYASYADTISQQFFSKPKLFWSWAYSRKAYRSPIPVCKHPTSDTLLTSDYDKAEAFSNHFSSIFTHEDTSDITSLQSALPPNNISSSLSTISIHPSDVYQVLIHLDISKACGPDLLSPCLLKEAAPVISPSLAGLFNKSIQDGSLPEDWVSANIAPVFKRGDKHLISNYRPISLTSIVSKVLERLIHHKLYSFLEQQKVISHTLWFS